MSDDFSRILLPSISTALLVTTILFYTTDLPGIIKNGILGQITAFSSIMALFGIIFVILFAYIDDKCS